MEKQAGREKRGTGRWPQLAVALGLVLLVGIVLIAKNPAPAAPAPAVLPEEQLDEWLDVQQPVLAFFHSTTCTQCLRMMEVVAEVHPEFAAFVALVDVDVDKAYNGDLLKRADVRAIPTLVLYDRSGQPQHFLGVMAPEQLRERLQALSAR